MTADLTIRPRCHPNYNGYYGSYVDSGQEGYSSEMLDIKEIILRI
jgi:hypothetical protein